MGKVYVDMIRAFRLLNDKWRVITSRWFGIRNYVLLFLF
jgi:hypothetical protein